MQLAHSSGLTPRPESDLATKQYVDAAVASAASGGIYFSWNHSDSSQFTLVSSPGWSLAYVAATSLEPEHLLLSAPGSWDASAGYAFLLVTSEMPTADAHLVVVHSVLDKDHDVYFGPLARYADLDNHVSLRWRQTPGCDIESGLAVWQRDGGVEEARAHGHETISLAGANPDGSDAFFMVMSHLWCKGGLVGGGWGCVNMLGIAPLISPEKEVGFGIYSLTRAGTGGAEKIKIYDFVVKPC